MAGDVPPARQPFRHVGASVIVEAGTVQKQLEAPGRDGLEQMWESHRESVRRLLLGLARDLDLADDLLQDTYLRARAGISSYRGGDARAWLAAVARSAFYTHARKRHVRAEVLLSEHEPRSEDATHDRVELLAVRQAIAELPPALRTALLMKHYAGFTYREIAGHTGCPVGTAKWRVSEALGALRAALRAAGRESVAECTLPDDISLIDYAYGVLPAKEAAKVKAHLAECTSCREQVEELQHVATTLDTLEGDHLEMHFIEVDAQGVSTLYVTESHVNASEETVPSAYFRTGRHIQVAHIYQDGEEISFTKERSSKYEGLDEYTATLARPVAPGQHIRYLIVFSPISGPATKPLGEGPHSFHWNQQPGSNETAYVQALRLPPGAKLVSSDPEPAEIRGNGTTTLVWRAVLAAHEFFECTVEYEGPQASS
jgi:RNA polymerase sigma-70 factor (ECF subfamily)